MAVVWKIYRACTHVSLQVFIEINYGGDGGRMNKTDWQIAFAYVGTVVGAGFASGQELVQFFVRFGAMGLLGVGLAGLLFAFLGGLTITLVKRYGLNTYRDLLDQMLGQRLAGLMDGLIMSFLFLGISVMLSGSGALFEEYLGLNPLVGIFVTEGMILLALAARAEGVLWFNMLTVPPLILILLTVSIASLFLAPTVNLHLEPVSVSKTWVSESWLLSALLYVFYNMVNGVVILVSLAGENTACSARGGIAGGVILLFLAFSQCLALLFYPQSVSNYQIPMLYLAYQVSPPLFYIFGSVLWIAMLTTALANGFGICHRLVARKGHYSRILLSVLILAFPFSLWEFPQLVGRVYPLFGYLSILATVIVILQVIRGKQMNV